VIAAAGVAAIAVFDRPGELDAPLDPAAALSEAG
jgi:hypothetical protein